MEEKNYFEILNGVNVNDKVEKKNGLSYLSWAYAWGELKKRYPDATYTVYENADGWNYFTDGFTCWVKTGVTVQGIEHIEYLPIMDYRNKSIPKDLITSFDVNKAIQRSLTKAVARHGLGLYIYAGEDLPEESDGQAEAAPTKAKTANKTSTAKATKKAGISADDKEARNRLVTVCQMNGIDINAVCKRFGLNNDSKPADFRKAAECIEQEIISQIGEV